MQSTNIHSIALFEITLNGIVFQKNMTYVQKDIQNFLVVQQNMNALEGE